MSSTPVTAAGPGAVSVAELERIAAAGWRGDTMTWRGEWLLRAGGGFTGRANSVLILGPPPDSIDAAIDAVDTFYADRGLDARIALPGGVPGGGMADDGIPSNGIPGNGIPGNGIPGNGTPGNGVQGGGFPGGDRVADALAARGWSPGPPVLVMTADLPGVLAATPPRPGLPRAVLEPVPSPEWLDGYRYRGGRAPGNALPVLLGADRPIFATVRAPAGSAVTGPGAAGFPIAVSVTGRPPGTPLGVARGVVDEGWLGISAVTVDETRRRLGVGTHLLGELARWAATQAAHSVYLQVDAANEPAVRLYAGRGFVVHHSYAYWSPGA